MKIYTKVLITTLFLAFGGLGLSSFQREPANGANFSFPYKQAGLTKQQAAAHLLSRFTFGARPGDVENVAKQGLEKWFADQLAAEFKDDTLSTMLNRFDILKMSNEQIVAAFPKGALVKRMAIKEGIISQDSVDKNNKGDRQKIAAFLKSKGYRPQQEMYRQLADQKILRAAYSENQLQELLTDFWFNHFNVSLTKNQCAEFIPSYERDVIRPNVMGKFETLLMSTAKSPAMLMYLDNFSSSGTNTNMQAAANNPVARKRIAMIREQMLNGSTMADDDKKKIAQLQNNKKKQQGLNENYAREVMELHTLGVDGGYTQSDVTQAARVLTGWTTRPLGAYGGGGMQKLMEKTGPQAMQRLGFVQDGDFLFVPSRHDTGEKTVLGKRFASNGGYQEGVELLEMLAHHKSTAQFISKKLATRFVSDNPPKALVDKMAQTFIAQDGDIKKVLITMVSAPEFWAKDALREKTKSPFELAISAVRAVDADIYQPYQLYSWVTKMGQQLYYYQAPTGFPDRGQYWINTGSLLNRMNFGLALASQRIPGVRVNLAALNSNHEPESAQDALATYSRLIMPQRDLNETIKRLTPMLNDPNLSTKIEQAAAKTAAPAHMDSPTPEEAMKMEMTSMKAENKYAKGKGNKQQTQTTGNNTMLAQVVGIIIGSPEYQRK